MTPEDKELLLKDLCARLPYGVKLGFYASATKQTYVCTLLGLEPQEDKPIIAKTENGSFYMLADNVKPYLFPLSSMTEEMIEEFNNVFNGSFQYFNQRVISASRTWDRNEAVFVGELECSKLIDWFNAHHIDYRGFIPKGQAIDATGLNIY